jgi:hypothetical protein
MIFLDFSSSPLFMHILKTFVQEKLSDYQSIIIIRCIHLPCPKSLSTHNKKMFYFHTPFLWLKIILDEINFGYDIFSKSSSFSPCLLKSIDKEKTSKNLIEISSYQPSCLSR